MFHLDTNIVIAALSDENGNVADNILTCSERNATVLISSIVFFELQYGIAKSQRRESNTHRLKQFLSGPVAVQPFAEDDAEAAGKIRAALERLRTPIRPYDILIAGQALRHGATLVTANTREFKRVPGLKLADWTTGERS